MGGGGGFGSGWKGEIQRGGPDGVGPFRAGARRWGLAEGWEGRAPSRPGAHRMVAAFCSPFPGRKASSQAIGRTPKPHPGTGPPGRRGVGEYFSASGEIWGLRGRGEEE